MEFSGNFKYGSVDLPLDPALEFRLEFSSTYGNVDFPKGKLRINDYNMEGSKNSFSGSTSENAICLIKFTSYDVDIDLD